MAKIRAKNKFDSSPENVLRVQPRAHLQLPAQIDVNGIKSWVQLVDLSESGLKISIDPAQKLSQRVTNKWTPVPGMPLLENELRLVWQKDVTAGFSFVRLSKLEKTILTHLARYHRAE